ncbi:AmpG family muropeptide MFS transporter [Roseospira marina]|uniref:AmpG family muropeptide MFS transporter n=1 Tax=Roseospira marina TaxID=140057 RepID=UPI0017D6E61E|nr:AmpG family muropeptide MFS transporter [Roseospira marina]MBB4314525.1 PAT family beta-lactamase induction signal transducer AmpG [Roseospira marina]MBB5088647.1 PAT family beta-lactamase induction signal transducer AmpG [Roseospira marina]
MSLPSAPLRNWAQSLAVYGDIRVLRVLFLGFASGLPLLLVFTTLSYWLAEAGVSKTAIGLFAFASSAYGFKFLWSPLVDRLRLPLLTRWLGQRRGWLLLAQGLIIGCMIGVGTTDPAEDLWWTALWAVLLAFASATQDIVIDAYRVETLEEHQLGAGAGTVVLGYRIGMVAASGGALIIADAAGWFWAYAVMAGLMGLGILTTLLSPEPDRTAATRTAAEEEDRVAAFLDRRADLAPWLRDTAGFLYGAVVCPFTDFMKRPHWILILVFIALYKYGDALLGNMAMPFYEEIGFTKTEVGVISKGFGVVMTIIGGLGGGLLVARQGIFRALLVCGVLQAASNLVFAWQAHVGADVNWLVVTIGVENLTGGMGTAAFVAYLSSLCNVAYTATQYALVSSLMSFARTFFSAGGGWLADHVDWVSYFLVTTVAAVPGLLLLLWMMRVFPAEGVRADPKAAWADD